MTTLNTILTKFEQDSTHLSDSLITTFKQLCNLSSEITHPASGQTYERWKVLAKVAATNLNLVKWFESHLDALSILHELGYSKVPAGVYAVWAAEGGIQPLYYQNGQCSGNKYWCSGAGLVDYGLMTYRDTQNNSQLLIVDMHQPDICIDHSGWNAVGMAYTQTAKISFNKVVAQTVGQPGQYLDRSGFWHGAAGVAACWYGAATRLAHTLQQACQEKPNTFRLMYLGEVNSALATTREYFKYVAAQIDQHPTQSHELIIRMLRIQTEQTAQKVLDLVGKALGARPFCENTMFAQMAADLPVFLRQSHAAFDLEQIGERSVMEDTTWML